jgi:hypothetical protein
MVPIASLQASDWIQLVIAVPIGCAFLVTLFWAIVKTGNAIILILKELKPNGGNSMKDRLAKLEKVNADQSGVMAEHTKQLDWIILTLNKIPCSTRDGDTHLPHTHKHEPDHK